MTHRTRRTLAAAAAKAALTAAAALAALWLWALTTHLIPTISITAGAVLGIGYTFRATTHRQRRRR